MERCPFRYSWTCVSGADRARVAAATCLVLGAGCGHDTEPLASLPEREVELVFTVGTGTSDTSIVFGMVNDAEILADASIVDRKSTRLNSRHVKISYAVFGLKKQ